MTKLQNAMLLEYVIAIYCLVDDLLKATGHEFDKRAKIYDSELISIVFIAAINYHSNMEKAYKYFPNYDIIRVKVDKSRLSRRLRALSSATDMIINEIGNFFIEMYSEKEFIVDSYPIACCDNIRISRSRLLLGEDVRAYKTSFRRYFYGVKLQLVTNKAGIPIRYTIMEGALSDAAALETLPLDMSRESVVYMDAGYTDYNFEDQIKRKKK